MKKAIITLCGVFALVFTMQAQIETPALSPTCKMSQKVGLTDVEIEYSRPSMRGRTIFAADGLVPFGETWRTGANASTKVSFSTDVKVEGKELKKGKYALYTIPGADEWTIIFYKNTSHWGVPREYNKEEEALRVMVKPEKMSETIETFTIMLGMISNNNAHLQLLWENTYVGVKIDVDADSKVIANIERVMAGPSANDYYAAAQYYHEAGMDLNQALQWVQKANEMDARFWTVRREALILADMEKYEKAIAVATKSKEMAAEAGNENYVRNNEKSISEWKALLGKAKDRSEKKPGMKKATKEKKM